MLQVDTIELFESTDPFVALGEAEDLLFGADLFDDPLLLMQSGADWSRLTWVSVPDHGPIFDGAWKGGSGTTHIGVNDAYIHATRWRVMHAPTVTCYLKVWFGLIVRASSYDLSPPPRVFKKEYYVYEWDTDEDPCFSGKADVPSVLDGLTGSEGPPIDSLFSSDLQELRAPVPDYNVAAANEYDRAPSSSEVMLVMYKYSIIPDYEPDDPVFDPQTGEFARPTPDENPNSHPSYSDFSL